MRFKRHALRRSHKFCAVSLQLHGSFLNIVLLKIKTNHMFGISKYFYIFDHCKFCGRSRGDFSKPYVSKMANSCHLSDHKRNIYRSSFLWVPLAWSKTASGIGCRKIWRMISFFHKTRFAWVGLRPHWKTASAILFCYFCPSVQCWHVSKRCLDTFLTFDISIIPVFLTPPPLTEFQWKLP